MWKLGQFAMRLRVCAYTFESVLRVQTQRYRGVLTWVPRGTRGVEAVRSKLERQREDSCARRGRVLPRNENRNKIIASAHVCMHVR